MCVCACVRAKERDRERAPGGRQSSSTEEVSAYDSFYMVTTHVVTTTACGTRLPASKNKPLSYPSLLCCLLIHPLPAIPLTNGHLRIPFEGDFSWNSACHMGKSRNVLRLI